MADIVPELIAGFVSFLGACALAEAGVAFLVRAPRDVEESIE